MICNDNIFTSVYVQEHNTCMIPNICLSDQLEVGIRCDVNIHFLGFPTLKRESGNPPKRYSKVRESRKLPYNAQIHPDSPSFYVTHTFCNSSRDVQLISCHSCHDVFRKFKPNHVCTVDFLLNYRLIMICPLNYPNMYFKHTLNICE